jgi:hypothetical protein
VAGLIFQRACTEEKKRNVRRRSWKPRARQPWTHVAPVTLSGIAKSRRFPNSAMRRYFNSHEVLLAEGSTRWSNRVCASLREPDAMSPSRVTEKLANGPVAGTPFCGLLRQPPPASRERGGSRQGCPDQVDQRLTKCRFADALRAGVAGAGTLAHETFLRPAHWRFNQASASRYVTSLNRPNGKS